MDDGRAVIITKKLRREDKQGIVRLMISSCDADLSAQSKADISLQTRMIDSWLL